MLLKSGRISVGQKQMDRFSLVIRFTLLLWLTLQVTAKPGEICTGPQGCPPCLPCSSLNLSPASRSCRAQTINQTGDDAWGRQEVSEWLQKLPLCQQAHHAWLNLGTGYVLCSQDRLLCPKAPLRICDLSHTSTETWPRRSSYEKSLAFLVL